MEAWDEMNGWAQAKLVAYAEIREHEEMRRDMLLARIPDV